MARKFGCTVRSFDPRYVKIEYIYGFSVPGADMKGVATGAPIGLSLIL